MAETNPTCASAGQNKFYMRKLILSAAGAVLLAASVFTFASVNKSDDPMDDLFKANVEALASGEGESINCIPHEKSVCVDGDRHVVQVGAYFSQH